jgi:hypothetical protein
MNEARQRDMNEALQREKARRLEARIVTLIARGARKRRVVRALKRLVAVDRKRAETLVRYRFYEKPAIEKASKAIGQLDPAMQRRVVSIVAAGIGGTVTYGRGVAA